jgi:hypothetical protein
VLADLARNAQRKARGKTPAFVSPLALAAVRQIDALFDLERDINSKSAADRLAARRELSLPLVAGLATWMQQERARLSRHNDVAGRRAGADRRSCGPQAGRPASEF